MDGLDRNGLILGETKNMPHVVEMRAKKAGTSQFDFPYVTPVTPGINGLITTFTDANGLVPGMEGYVGPVVQTPILKIVTDDILYADLTTDSYTFSSAVDAIAIKNDGTSDLTVTISTLLFTIKPGESRIIEMASFTVVAFSANATFRMNGLRRS